MKRPRSDVVAKRFMAGEEIEAIAGDTFERMTPERQAATSWNDLVLSVEAALRRAMLKSEKRRRRSR